MVNGRTNRASARSARMRGRRLSVLALALAVGLVAAACGGGDDDGDGGNAGATTSTLEETTTTSGVTDSTATGDTTPTTAGTNATTATTSRTATTRRSTTATTARRTTGANNPSGGITNVTSAPTSAKAADVEVGGTITYLKGSDPLGFDPINLTAASGADAPTSFAVYGALVYSDPADGQVKPQMADALTSTDALVWNLKLRPNIKFTDGTAYDAAAVKFNWARLQDPNNRASRATSANLIQAMDVVDALNLKITLKVKNAIFPQTVALIPYVASPAALQAKGSGYNSDPVGAGPFTLRSWTRDSQMVLVRNPAYWDAPKPYVDQLIMKPVIDEAQRANTMNAGQANMLFTVTPQTADMLRGKQLEYAAVQNGGPNLLFNMRSGQLFSDIRARRAVTMAVDRCDLVKVVLNNAVDCSDSIMRKTSPYYDAGILQPAYNPTEAQRLFDELAATQPGGKFKFRLTNFPTGNFPKEGEYIQAKLNSYRNVEVELVVEAVNLHITNVLSGNFQATIYSNPFDDPEPTWTSVYTCANQNALTGFCSTKFDQHIASNQVTLDPKQRITDLKEAQREFYTQIPGFYFERRVTWNFGASNIQDVSFVNDGTILWDRLWIKTRG